MERQTFLLIAMLAALLLALPSAPGVAQAARALRATAACDGGDGVYLYESPNYRGRCIKIIGDVPDLGAVNFNDTASSVRIVGDWITSLFENRDYGGASSFFTDSDANLVNNTIGDNRASSVGARRGTRETLCDGGEGVYLYDQLNFRGRCTKVTDSYPDLSPLSFNNIVSSIRFVGSGWTAALYVDQNYGGARSVFTKDDPDLRNNTVGDDSASSIGVSRSGISQADNCNGGEGVYLYEHANYQGRCVKFTTGSPDLRTVGFDDTASSIRLVGSWTATLYRDLNGTGIASTFTGDDPNLADNPIGDNQVTSIQIERAVPIPAANACNGGSGVYLYEHPNYQGRCVKFTTDAPDLRVFGFDDIASSVRVLGSWTATLYRDLSGTGIASTLTRDDPNLADNSVGDNLATSVLVRRR
ncbi:MAG TPA: beta/gamma crystallin-related protein [Roseiflexaceae bacterium]|nr:beta/gamma crystallin-related protein [Roseiflexaceae bacterium]